MNIKNMSNSKKMMALSGAGISIGVVIYGICDVLGYDYKFKSYLLFGIGLGVVICLISSIVKLKRDGVLYDERDGRIEEKTNALAFDVFQIILVIIGLFTYKIKTGSVSIGGYTFLLLFIAWITRGIIYLIVKKRN